MKCNLCGMTEHYTSYRVYFRHSKDETKKIEKSICAFDFRIGEGKKLIEYHREKKIDNSLSVKDRFLGSLGDYWFTPYTMAEFRKLTDIK